MIKNISIRLRITLITVLLLTICCVGLTLILNFSANNIAKKMTAIDMYPAYEMTDSNRPQEITPSQTPDLNEQHLIEAQTSFRKESIIYLFIIITLGGAMTYFITGKSLKPLNDLNDQVKNINAHNLSENLEVPPTKDEISELTNSFNEMTDKLQNTFAIQQRFSASAAHELKTPLAILQAKVDVFKMEKSHTNEEYTNLINIFEQQIYRLRGLVSNLLNMTNMDDYNEKSTVCLKDIFEDIISELSLIAKDKNIDILLNCDDCTAFGNTDLLYRAFYNLVENGIKYNVNNGKIIVTVRNMNDERVSIKISDTGIGIPDEMKKHIFEPFYRVDKSRSRSMGGAGLGLSIVESIIKKQSGNICVSDNENGGTCFEIILESKDDAVTS